MFCRGQHVGGIKTHHVERETGSEAEILAVALVGVFVVVAGAEERTGCCTNTRRRTICLFPGSSLKPPGASPKDLNMPVIGDIFFQSSSFCMYSSSPSMPSA